MSEVLYNHILDEVRTRIELFGMERDALMVLLDEYLKLLESSEAESFLTKTNLEETFEVPEEQETSPFWLDATIMVNEGGRDIDIGRDNCKICSSCGVKNPAEANFCISCATKLPSISKIDEI
ncbi:MAG: zinc-ribbon domain-containing protein [Thermoproteota archaeon]